MKIYPEFEDTDGVYLYYFLQELEKIILPEDILASEICRRLIEALGKAIADLPHGRKIKLKTLDYPIEL